MNVLGGLRFIHSRRSSQASAHGRHDLSNRTHTSSGRVEYYRQESSRVIPRCRANCCSFANLFYGHLYKTSYYVCYYILLYVHSSWLFNFSNAPEHWHYVAFANQFCPIVSLNSDHQEDRERDLIEMNDYWALVDASRIDYQCFRNPNEILNRSFFFVLFISLTDNINRCKTRIVYCIGIAAWMK